MPSLTQRGRTVYDINGSFKMLNAAGKVTKWRSGMEPVSREVIVERIARAKRKIRSLQSAERDMKALIGA